MPNADIGESTAPFESASELKEGHARLLDQLDAELKDNSSSAGEAMAFRRLEPQVRRFIQRGAATGVYLDDIPERTVCSMLLEYWVSGLSQAGLSVSGARLARFDSEQLPDLNNKSCPYVGLDAFRAIEFFFGREMDTQKLVSQVESTPLVIVLGASGSGKSSLVMGGALPAIRRQKTLRVVPPFVPGHAVLEHLAAAVFEAGKVGGDVAAEAQRLRENTAYLATMLDGAQAPPTVVTIDQFEEVFTLSEAADRLALASNLVSLLKADRGHRVILMMREEFRSRIVELSQFGSYLDQAWYFMRPMGYDELKAAVEKPAAIVNLRYQPGIVDDLVKKVLGQPAALPLLQFTLRRLWDSRDRNRITWEVYRKVGDPLNALKTSADQFFDGLAQQTQDEVRRILLQLVHIDDLLEAYREPVSQQALLQAGKANTMEVIRLLARNDYIRITQGAGDNDSVVEVKHESLIRNWPRYVAWIDEKRVGRRQRLALTQAASRWARNGMPKEGLLTGWQLEDAKRQEALSREEQEFVKASADEIESAQRQEEAALRRKNLLLMTGLVAAAVIIIVISGIALHLRQKSIEIADEDRKLKKDQEQLQADFANLQTEHNILKSQYGQTPTPPVPLVPQRGRGGPDRQQTVTIFLQISDEDQRARAQKIGEELRGPSLRVMNGIEKVRPVSRSDLRYFHAEDKTDAENVQKLLEQHGVKAEIKLIGGFDDRVPRRQLEIWFGMDSLGAESGPQSP